MDVSNNTALALLNCGSNDSLNALDLTANVALVDLMCGWANLASLDVTNNPLLSTIMCLNNNLTSLDVSNNTVLAHLDCSHNDLQCLNIKNGNNTGLGIFYADYNPNLTCIEVDDVNYASSIFGLIDPQTSFSLYCANSCSNVTSINKIQKSSNLLKIIDVLGRETELMPNKPLIFIYDDGTYEKKIIIR